MGTCQHQASTFSSRARLYAAILHVRTYANGTCQQQACTPAYHMAEPCCLSLESTPSLYAAISHMVNYKLTHSRACCAVPVKHAVHRHTLRHLRIHTYHETPAYTHMHTYIHTSVYTYIRTCIHTYIRMHIHTYTHTHIHIGCQRDVGRRVVCEEERREQDILGGG